MISTNQRYSILTGYYFYSNASFMILNMLGELFGLIKIILVEVGFSEKKTFLIQNAYYVSECDLAYIIYICLFIDCSLSNLLKKSLIDKQINNFELFSSMLGVLMIVEAPFAWKRFLYLRFLFILCEVTVKGPQSLFNTLTSKPVLKDSIAKKVNPVYLTHVVNHSDF